MSNKPSVEDLLEAAKQEGEVTYTDAQKANDAQDFINAIGLKNGTDRYSLGLIELLYKNWSKKHVFDKTVHTLIRKYIKYDRNNGVYFIDESALIYTLEEVKKIAVNMAFKYRAVNDEEKKEDKKKLRRIKTKQATQASKVLYRL